MVEARPAVSKHDVPLIPRLPRSTHAGEREVKQALRKTLFNYKLHQDRELFDRAYGYVRQHY